MSLRHRHGVKKTKDREEDGAAVESVDFNSGASSSLPRAGRETAVSEWVWRHLVLMLALRRRQGRVSLNPELQMRYLRGGQ